MAATEAERARYLRRTKISAVGGAHIDAHVDAFIAASPTEREQLVQHILATATDNADLGSANWTAQSVFNRLKNTRSLRNRAV